MSLHFHGLRTTIYKVDNILKAKEWYNAVFAATPYFDEPFYVGYNIGGYELGLQPDKNSADLKTANVLTYWGVDNVKATYDELLHSGATPFEEPMDVGDGIIVAAVKDPWGNAVGIIYNPHFSLKE